jgi:hypothetical protein
MRRIKASISFSLGKAQMQANSALSPLANQDEKSSLGE